MATLRLKEATRTQLTRAARLHKREQRRRFGQTLVEGPQAVRELLRCAPDRVRDLYITPQACESHDDIRSMAAETQVFTHIISPDTAHRLFPDAQGICAVIHVPSPQNLADILAHARLVLACVHIADPGNVGTLIRVADAAGADAILLASGSAEVYSPKVIRASAGSIFHLPIVDGLSLSDICSSGKDNGLRIFAADGNSDQSLADFITCDVGRSASQVERKSIRPSLSDPTMWVLGNEAHGFSGVDMSVFDAVVSIPIYGAAESLNIAIAGAIMAYTSAFVHHLLPSGED